MARFAIGEGRRKKMDFFLFTHWRKRPERRETPLISGDGMERVLGSQANL